VVNPESASLSIEDAAYVSSNDRQPVTRKNYIEEIKPDKERLTATLGNGGDATLWIHPQAAAVKAVLADPTNANYAYFKAVFVENNNPGITSNCNFGSKPVSCNARPVHDGIFIKIPG
jgi:hypothetical protein